MAIPNQRVDLTLRPRDVFFLLLITLVALLVHGYHPWAEDAEIYVPGIVKILHPQSFPFNSQFFESHAHLTLFPELIATSVRVSHLRLEVVLLIWQMAAIFLLLWASCELLALCFPTSHGRWAGVGLVASLLTLPVAGSALYILDQYTNPRNLAAFALVFAVARIVQKRFLRTGVWLIFAGAIHPLMATFTFCFCVLYLLLERIEIGHPVVASGMLPPALMPFGIALAQPSPAYHQVALLHSFHYFLQWKWYEMLGVFGPLVLLWWFARIARSRRWTTVDRLCRALVIFQLIFIPPAVVLSSSPRFESLARFQPMRSVYLLYVLFILIAGGFLGEFVLQKHRWRWVAWFVPLCFGMFAAQIALFPGSQHLELPGVAPKNQWEQAFLWIQANTPADSIFALDPHHMSIAGEDNQGFRAIAQRSMLADTNKDSGAVSMFPPMAEEWQRQVQSQQGWEHFRLKDFQRLRAQYGVSWIIVQQPGVASLTCPYQNYAVQVCNLN